jgi:hypothetical protein
MTMKMTFKVNAFHGHLYLEGSTGEGTQNEKEISKSNHICSSHLHFGTVPGI